MNVQLLGKYPPFKQLLDIQFTNAILVSILPGVCDITLVHPAWQNPIYQQTTAVARLPIVTCDGLVMP